MKMGVSLARLALAHMVVLACLLGVAAQGLCAEKIWVDAAGYVLFKNDRGDVVRKDFVRYADVLFDDMPKKTGYFFCTLDGLETQVPVRDILTVKRDPNTDFGTVTTTNTPSHAVKIPQDLAGSLTGMDHFEMEYFNALTGKNEVGFILGTDVLEIHFTDTSRVSK
ncbi:hypothetical protein [Megalodesulfovibrio gigas]|uniref:Uncharacterized protein n=1 Tax=Megalodesulfovibrio gigas (strain ATCC 19364 / DSM 1382 / NCIMB 9332 / VKM B-1759) TaxID=1121448 RepID=T2G8L1_MEGG1|nr:hypothetical protein [Megalodesulfovibrio gigas]AGW12476.1 hypothetical protein DGI_0568 [Megalodesulfovibrio gigas DSM 1382 = ATCC 19364]